MTDPYHYARDHDQGPGAWCVYGPIGFKMTVPNLDKSTAYIIGKLLSGQNKEAAEMLNMTAAAWIRYGAASHRVRTAIGALMDTGHRHTATEPKHMRTSIDLQNSDLRGLSGLLIAKGIFTEDEYAEAITKAAEAEAADYEDEVQDALGNPGIRTV